MVFRPRSLYPSPGRRPVTRGTSRPPSQARGLPRNQCVPSFSSLCALAVENFGSPDSSQRSAPHLQGVCITRLPERAQEALRLSRHSPSGAWGPAYGDQQAGSERAPVCTGRVPPPVGSGAPLGARAPSRRLGGGEAWELGPVDGARVPFPLGGARVCAGQMITKDIP